VLAGLHPGAWNVTRANGQPVFQAVSEAGKNTLFFMAKGGRYRITPQPTP